MEQATQKELLFVIPTMMGGGAERVLGIIASNASERGYDVVLMLTNQEIEEAVGYTLNPKVKLESLVEIEKPLDVIRKLQCFFLKQYSRLFGTIIEKLKLQVPDNIAYSTFICQYKTKVKALRQFLIDNPEMEIIAFCQPSVNIALLATNGLPNKVVLSERLDPARYSQNRYMPYFVKEWYPKAKHIVFQSEGARSWFDEKIKSKSSVIFNPLKPGLPEPYKGTRKKVIITFCRITQQKNLKLLVDAFIDVLKVHSDYTLKIYGDGEKKIELADYIKKQDVEKHIELLPFDSELHEKIIDCTMYVNSSDYEGMSNSMLEAMAIGLPIICTDCPAGGARAIIKNHYNGILTPVGDKDALAKAMIEIIENPQLVDEISRNTAKVRDELEVNKIVSQWMDLL